MGGELELGWELLENRLADDSDLESGGECPSEAIEFLDEDRDRVSLGDSDPLELSVDVRNVLGRENAERSTSVNSM